MADNALKAELTARLNRSRSLITRQLINLKEDLDIAANVKQSFIKHKIPWIGGATLLGWGLSRLNRSSRVVLKEKCIPQKSSPQKKSSLTQGVAKLLFQAARPALTAFATQKIAGIVSKNR